MLKIPLCILAHFPVRLQFCTSFTFIYTTNKYKQFWTDSQPGYVLSMFLKLLLTFSLTVLIKQAQKKKGNSSGIDDTHSNAGNDEESVMEENVQEDDSHTGLAAIDRQATDIASSLVKTCLSQLCKCLHDYKSLSNNAKNQTIHVQREDFNVIKLYWQILPLPTENIPQKYISAKTQPF